MVMKEFLNIFKLLSDEKRVRLLMILSEEELCVCQLMGILGASQPLISHNLSLLSRDGFLDERKEGKLVYYKLKEEIDQVHEEVIRMLRELLKDNRTILNDLITLEECAEFQKRKGRCDMKTFKEFLIQRKRIKISPK